MAVFFCKYLLAKPSGLGGLGASGNHGPSCRTDTGGLDCDAWREGDDWTVTTGQVR
jgi:hypothetical protein